MRFKLGIFHEMVYTAVRDYTPSKRVKTPSKRVKNRLKHVEAVIVALFSSHIIANSWYNMIKYNGA